MLDSRDYFDKKLEEMQNKINQGINEDPKMKNYDVEYKTEWEGTRTYWQNGIGKPLSRNYKYYKRKVGETKFRWSAVVRDIFLLGVTGALWFAFGYGCYAANQSVQINYKIGVVKNKIDIREKTLDTYKQVNLGLGSNTFDFNTFQTLTDSVDKLYEEKAQLQRSKVPTDFEGGFMIPLGAILSIFSIAGLVFAEEVTDHKSSRGRYFYDWKGRWTEVTEEEYKLATEAEKL